MSYAFLSHSWRNKSLARRIARRLQHRGIKIWIDESEMQIGDQLSERIIGGIRQSKWFLVLLTTDAIKSKWVTREIDIALQTNPRPSIIALVAEAGLHWECVEESLGIEIFDPLSIEERLETLSTAILSSPTEQIDPGILDHDLKIISQEAPELRELITALMTERITIAQLAAARVTESVRHPAETALIALFERSSIKGRYVISLVAARFYRELGVGYPVLQRQLLLSSPDSDDVSIMFLHLGDRLTRTADFEGAFRLFELAKVRPDQAFCNFVRENFDRFDDEQKNRAVEFTVTPDRGPAGFSQDLAFELFSRMPSNSALKALWYFWINDYRFGGLPDKTAEGNIVGFYSYMNEAASKGLTQFNPIVDHFRSCFHSLVRSRNIDKINSAISLLDVAVEQNYAHISGLSNELYNAVGSSEWHDTAVSGELNLSIHKLAVAAVEKSNFIPLLDDYRRLYLKERS